MFKSLKKVLTIAAAAGLMFTACNGNAGFEATDADFPAASRSASTESNTVRIYSDLNPGFGNAVYFSGSFDAANTWTTAVRGSYDNGWYADVEASSTFEWKALTGAYSLGETTAVSNLSWEAGENHVYTIENPSECNLYVLTQGGYAHYGATCYFTGSFNEGKNWTEAVHNYGFSWENYKWFSIVTADGDFEWKSLTGFGDHGSTYAAPFNGLNWSEGANFTKADALTFAQFWADYVSVGYVSSSFNFENKTVTVYSTGSTYSFDDYVNSAATIVEILKNGEVVYSATHDFTKENEFDIDVSFIDNLDKTIYDVAVYPVNVYGDKGRGYKTQFSVGMVKVNGGYNEIGCDTDSDDENTSHVITLNSYWIGRYEVTDGEFQKVFGASSSLLAYKYYGLEENDPAISINYYFAVAYCNKRSIAEGLTPVYEVEGIDFESLSFSDVRYLNSEKRALFDNAVINKNANGYRLPTEAEWEVAARGGKSYAYAGSDNIGDVAVVMATNQFRAMNVGSLAPNGFGIYDMSGNVEELVQDFYAPFTAETVNNPAGPATGTERVVRGGGFSMYGDEYFTVYNRRTLSLSGYSTCTGFRVVRNVR